MPQETPAGWYPAPHANNEMRYWDGQGWQDVGPTAADAPTTPMPGLQPEQATLSEPIQAPQAPQGSRARGIAIAALIIGIAAFLTGLVPVLGLLLALTGVALAILALVRRQPKGLAITGLALGSVALLTGIIATTVGLAGPGTTPTAADVTDSADATSEVSPAAEPTEEPPVTEAAEAEPAEEAPAAEAAEAAEPAEAEPEPAVSEAAAVSGTIENPSPQPYVATGLFGGEKYSLTARIVDANANALVMQWNMFNSEAPAGFKYVVTELVMTGIDPDGVEPSLASYDLSLATPEGNQYDSEYIIFGDGMPSMDEGPTLYPGTSFTGYTAYIVPESAQSFLLHDNGEYVAF